MMKVWAKRHRDLARHRTRVACGLHAVLCDLVPGGIATQISAAQATRLLDDIEPDGAVAAARRELAAELVADLSPPRHSAARNRRHIAAAVEASKTTLTELFGVGPIVAATVIGDVADIARFPSRDHFAAYNGTAPIEVSSGRRKIYRLSRRGNRRLNHAIHMAAVTQIRHRHSPGRGYYDRKIAQGHSGKEAIRALKRRISDAIFIRLRDDAARAERVKSTGPGGQPRNDTETSAAGSHPEHRLFGQATPGPATTLRPTHNRVRPSRPNDALAHYPKDRLTNKEDSLWITDTVAEVLERLLPRRATHRHFGVMPYVDMSTRSGTAGPSLCNPGRRSAARLAGLCLRRSAIIDVVGSSGLRGGVSMPELLAALSLGTDLGMGHPMEHVLRQTYLALRLAEEMGLGADRARDRVLVVDDGVGRLSH